MLQGSPEWLETRAKCAITWSEAANALGIGYDTRQLYMKRKLKLVPKKESNWNMMEGNKREPHIAEMYFRIMAAFSRPVTLWTDAFTVLPQDSRMGGSVDRIVTCDSTKERWVLEIKSVPNGDMRTHLPISHNIQMMGLCKTMGCDKAHYIAHSYGQGIYLAEITWDPSLWDEIVFPRLQEFADMWERKEIPTGMKSAEKELLKKTIEQRTFIHELPCIATKMQKRAQLRTSPNKPN